VFLTIGRIGRSIGVHLLLSSQRIESGRLRGLDTYLSYRLALRTFSESESSVVLDTTDAFHLPALPGYAYLKVDTSVYTQFRASYVSSALVSAHSDAGRSYPRVLRLGSYPGILAANNIDPIDSGPAPVVRSVEPTLLDTLLGRIGAEPASPARTVWLAPLPDQLSLDAVLGLVTLVPGVGPRGADVEPMHVPLGLLDDPPARSRGRGSWI
jgi:S-DNA-T family DNA segregation ATPase FtsK/SpoIIIE